MPFARLGLYSSLVRGAQAMGYVEPTPIQRAAIPAILAGRDLVASAPTGTGKTAAVAVPVLNRLGARTGRPARGSSSSSPLRELAAQVATAFGALGRGTDLKTLVLHGGVPLGPQREALRAGTDIIVATPGRLREFLDTNFLHLNHVQVLVLDEVDRMLDLGFIDDVKLIVKACPPQRQTLLFSATVPPKLEEVAKFALREPLRIGIDAEPGAAATIDHALHPVLADQKFDLLLALLSAPDCRSAIVFTRTKAGADRVAHCLRLQNHPVAVLHADRSQSQRAAALAGFQERAPGDPRRHRHRGPRPRRRRGVACGQLRCPPESRGLRAPDRAHGPGPGQRRRADPRRARGGASGESRRCHREIHREEDSRSWPGRRLRLRGRGAAAGRLHSKPVAGPPDRAASGSGRGRPDFPGEAGANQDRAYRQPAHGGGHPTWHPKGKPGAHWRKREGR